MGWAKDAKAESVRDEAAKARANGRTTFAAKLNYPATRHGFSGEVVDWSMMIEAIESEGWTLCHFTGVADTKGRPEALCMFRAQR